MQAIAAVSARWARLSVADATLVSVLASDGLAAAIARQLGAHVCTENLAPGG